MCVCVCVWIYFHDLSALMVVSIWSLSGGLFWYVLFQAQILQELEGWTRKPVNHTSWVAVVTPTVHPKSVRNRCLIKIIGGIFVL